MTSTNTEEVGYAILPGKFGFDELLKAIKMAWDVMIDSWHLLDIQYPAAPWSILRKLWLQMTSKAQDDCSSVWAI